jgi:hypothetical protein
MSRHTIPMDRSLGITVDLDYSWFLIVGLLAWLLAVSYYLPNSSNGAPRKIGCSAV